MTAQAARGEARGRLDFFGGLAAEAGALVLAMPTRATTRVEVARGDGGGMQTFSCQSERERATFTIQSTTLRALFALPLSQWRGKLEAQKTPAWMIHLWGSLGVFVRHTGWWPVGGLRIRVTSDIPWARGIASSSALCMATFNALEQYASLEFEAADKACWSLEVEQEVLGLPCSVSTPLACSSGGVGEIVPVLCRPDQVRESFALPVDATLVGCPLAPNLQASDAQGRLIRTAARMGSVFLHEKLGGREYASEYTPSQLGNELPLSVRGCEFQSRFGLAPAGIDVDSDCTYPVRAATRFGVEENFRAITAQALLKSENAAYTLPIVGELLYQSHVGMGAMGLTTPTCNAFIEALRARGSAKGIYGARVTGEGTTRTIVVLLKKSARADLERIRANFSPAGTLIA